MYDIEMFRGYPGTTVRGLTDKGRSWILRNMQGSKQGRIKITHEAEDDVAKLMEKDGLVIKRNGCGYTTSYFGST